MVFLDDLTLNDYQQQASSTALYPGQGGFIGLAYASLGLNGEAGETGEQVKKIWRDDAADIELCVLEAVDEAREALRHGGSDGHDAVFGLLRNSIARSFRPELTLERKEKILKELGDTLWYAAQVATEIGVSLGDVAQANLDKLAARRAAGKISGEGSDR
jgi:NTP pyrophosphatase (non-canonical NTP hydrolase)